MVNEKACTKCGVVKPLTDFSPNKSATLGVRSKCKACVAQYMRDRRNSSEEERQYHLNYHKAWRQRLKSKVFQYFGAICECCGETEEKFLTLDHVNNDGADHKRALRGVSSGRGASTDTVYRDLVKSNFANASMFRLLCFNCNCGRQINGGLCPHQAK